MEEKVLFLDYDGVLFDTLREVYVVNRFIYLKKNYREEIEESNYSLYSKYKFLVYNIWMFYYYNPLIFNSLEEDKIIPSFNEAILKRDIKKEEQYCREFLEARSDLIKNDYNFWQNLETPFSFFDEIKKLYQEKQQQGKKINLVIASKKNKSSILERLNANNFNLDEKFVFAREILDKYSSKGEFMQDYMNKNGYKKAIFVDDNPNNIKSCESYSSKIRTILAPWGNSGPVWAAVDVKQAQIEAISEIKEFFN